VRAVCVAEYRWFGVRGVWGARGLRAVHADANASFEDRRTKVLVLLESAERANPEAVDQIRDVQVGVGIQ
jgi:hypothetical protein